MNTPVVSFRHTRLWGRPTHLDELAEPFNLTPRICHAVLNLLHPFLDSLDTIASLCVTVVSQRSGVGWTRTHVLEALQAFSNLIDLLFCAC